MTSTLKKGPRHGLNRPGLDPIRANIASGRRGCGVCAGVAQAVLAGLRRSAGGAEHEQGEAQHGKDREAP